MAWLDDRIRDHPKFVGLSDRAFREWAHALCYCSEHGTGGRLDSAVVALRIPKTIVRELVKAGVWDEEDDGLWVHDWQEHNDKRDQAREEKRAQARERQRKHRERVRASRVTERDSHTDVTRDNQRDVTRDRKRDTSRGRAGAGAPRARDHDHDQGNQGPSSSIDVDDDTLEKLHALGPGTDQLDRWLQTADDDPERFAACLNAAEAKGENVAAYLDTLIANGSRPQTPEQPDSHAIWSLYLEGYSWDDATSEDQVLDELRRRHERIEGFELDPRAALTTWKAARAARYPDDDPEPDLSTTTADSGTITD